MADISKITTLDGTTYDLKDSTARSSIPSAASATPLMDGTGAVGTSTKYAREDHKHPSDTTKVSTSGNETISGNKTFSGTTSLTADSIYPASVNTAIPSNSAAIIQSPIPKYLWHDIMAFCRDCTPTYYTTTDGSTWTEATLAKNLFMHKMTWGRQNAIDTTIKGSRWIWTTNSWSYSSASWLLIGVSYSATNAYFDITLESADSSGNWSTLLTKTKCYYNSVPVWFRTSTPGSVAQYRLTIIRNAEDSTTNILPITSIRWLASRWGDQGRGEELEYPYQWDDSLDIYPVTNNTSTLGTSSYKWANVYATTFNGDLSGNASSATKATQDESGNNIKATYASSFSISDHTITLKNKNGSSLGTVTVPDNNTTYTANTSKLVTTTVPNVTSAGSAPTLGTAIPADDITAWTTNTPTAVSVSQGVLTLTSGSAASLSYTAKSIPNVTSVGSAPTLGTAITVATGSLSGTGGGATVATGITPA